MVAPLLLGTDIGTFGTKSCIIDVAGKVLSDSFVETDILIPRPGWAEQWPDVWWRAYLESVRKALEKANVDPKDVSGVSVSGLYTGSGVPVDSEFKPLRPGIIWMDRRANEETEFIRKEIGEDYIFKRTGNIVDPYFGITKILWIKRHEPRIWEKIHQLMTAYGYIIYKLTGKSCIDHSSAGVIGGIYDIYKRGWAEDLMEELGIPRDFFPENINMSKDVVGEIGEEGSRATGLKRGTPVVAGGIDATVSALSVTALNDGDLASMLGTSMCNGFIQDEPRLSKKLVNFPYVAYDDHKLYSFAGIITAGAAVRWFRDEFAPQEKCVAERTGTSAYVILDSMAEKIPPGAEGLIFTPHMTVGERAPYWNPHLRSCLFGLTLYHHSAHIFRAFLESIAYAIRDSIEAAKEAGIPVKKALLVNGCAKSPLWRQIIADVTGMEFTYMKDAPGAPLGDALLAGVGTGLLKYEDIYNWVKEAQIVRPNIKNINIYNRYYSLYKKIRESLEEFYKEFSSLGASNS
ncbi:MAG: FGGY-family carbohydrate kinase [Candidatus Bathyarchaeia archaeon]